MEQPDFRVLIKRLPGSVPLVALRFEMSEGYGELIVGDDRKAAPAATGEIAEATGEEVRAGRFVHVLASGRRRQSYSFSHLDDARLQRIDDRRWTPLVATLEFGLRYLDLSDIDAVANVAAIAVSANPAPSRAHGPSSAQPAAPRVSLPGNLTTSQSGSQSPAPARVGSPAARPGSIGSANPAPPRAASPGPSPAPPPEATLPPSSISPDTYPPNTGSGSTVAPSVGVALTEGAVRRLSVDDARGALLREIATNRALHQRVHELEVQLGASLARERDLIELIARWQARG